MKKIVVTGHKGFIGRYLTEELSRLGHSFYGMDLKESEEQNVVLHSTPPCDTIFHLSAQTSVPDSMENPFYDAVNNILATIRILKDNPNAKIIVASSVASIEPESPYGVSKLAIEKYAHILHKNCVVCRFPNVFAEDDHGVMTRFINEKEITVYGDGTQTRDMVYVGDIVKGLMQAVNWPAGTYEFGSEKSCSVLDMAKATGKNITFADKRAGDKQDSIGKNTTPNWKPVVDPIGFIRLNVK